MSHICINDLPPNSEKNGLLDNSNRVYTINSNIWSFNTSTVKLVTYQSSMFEQHLCKVPIFRNKYHQTTHLLGP